MTSRFLHIVILFILAAQAFSQSASVKVQGRAIHEKILLRWGLSTPISWHYAKKYGFTIEKTKIVEGGKVVKIKIPVILTDKPLKPAELPDWEAFMEDDYVAIAAQAIYGETFETQQGNSGMVQMINQAKELENRFSFLMFACDQSVQAARLSGLYFEDDEVQEDTKYLYRIYANVPPEIHQIDTGSIYIGLADYSPLPPPRDVAVEFDDQTAMISWNSSIYTKYYNAFWVERSDDGGRSFKRIHEKPLITTIKKPGSLNERAYKADSLAENEKNYQYRVLGISAFGELSTPSDTVGGMGRPAFVYAPAIAVHEILTSGGVRIDWTFPETFSNLVSNFGLLRQHSDQKGFDTVIAGMAPDARSVVDTFPQSSNYYLIEARDQYGQVTRSFPYFVQLEDSIPPVPPMELTGSIDSAGIVRITWKDNTEADLSGYKVYRSNFEDAEFIQVPGAILTASSYTETIPIKNLTRDIFYRVKAFDRHYNPSEFSEILKLEKPDVIPPVTPVFRSIHSDSLGVILEFEQSPSTDVEIYLIYRRAAEETDWTLLSELQPDAFSGFWYDQNVQHNTRYAYTIIAVDDSGLESEPAPPLVALWKDPDPYPRIHHLEFKKTPEKRELEIFWAYSGKHVSRFLIYKSFDGTHFQLFKTVAGEVYTLKDTYKLSNEQLSYRIMAEMNDGGKSRMSESIMIK